MLPCLNAWPEILRHNDFFSWGMVAAVSRNSTAVVCQKFLASFPGYTAVPDLCQSMFSNFMGSSVRLRHPSDFEEGMGSAFSCSDLFVLPWC